MARPVRKTRKTRTTPATRKPRAPRAPAKTLPIAVASPSEPATKAATQAKSAKPTKPSQPATAKPDEKVRTKLIRDSFTMPREDFDLIAQLKARALDFKRPTKKSELLRAGLQALAAYDDARLQSALQGLRVLKTGRPKKKKH